MGVNSQITLFFEMEGVKMVGNSMPSSALLGGSQLFCFSLFFFSEQDDSALPE